MIDSIKRWWAYHAYRLLRLRAHLEYHEVNADDADMLRRMDELWWRMDELWWRMGPSNRARVEKGWGW